MILINNILKERFSDKLNIKILELKNVYLPQKDGYNRFHNLKNRYNRFFVRKGLGLILNNKFYNYFLDKIEYSIITSNNYLIYYNKLGKEIKLKLLITSEVFYIVKQFSFIKFEKNKYILDFITIGIENNYEFN